MIHVEDFPTDEVLDDMQAQTEFDLLAGAGDPVWEARAYHFRAVASLAVVGLQSAVKLIPSKDIPMNLRMRVDSFQTFRHVVLPLIGLIFVVETLSDIVQIGYFKLSGGKRVHIRLAEIRGSIVVIEVNGARRELTIGAK